MIALALAAIADLTRAQHEVLTRAGVDPCALIA
jgi:hypothetical protein